MAISFNQCLTTANQISVLSGQHEQVTIEGNVYGLITIGSRRYLIDYVNSRTGLAWYDDTTTHLEYLTTAASGTAVNALPMNGVCMPFLTDDQVKSSSWEDACRSTATLKQIIESKSGITSTNKSKYAGYYVSSLNNLGLRWSLPNYELEYYIVNRLNEQYQGREEQDWLSMATGWFDIIDSEGVVYFWLPFSSSVVYSWSCSCSIGGPTGLSSYGRASAYSGLVSLPCSLI